MTDSQWWDHAACWVLFGLSFLQILLIYHGEQKAYGGAGMASLLSAVVVVYNLLNPLFYLIHPLLALNFALLVGLEQSPSFLLPNILSTAVFMCCLSLYVWHLPHIKVSRHRATARPISGSRLRLTAGMMVVLICLGLALYIGRNIAAFGSWNGSFSAAYAGDTARPQVPILSNYSTVWLWAIQLASIVCLWQVEVKKMRFWWTLVPASAGLFFALIEGDRALLGTSVLVLLGWHGLGARITLKKATYILCGLVLLTLAANARYNKAETSMFERVRDLFRVEYFRPFWSSDAYGVATAATVVCWKAQNEGGYTLGLSYVESALSNVPRFIWAGRPANSTDAFAQWFDEREGKDYVPGTGYAFNGIAEAFLNFWFLGPALLGLGCGYASDRLARASLGADDLSGRVLFALSTPIVLWTIARNSITVFLSPIMIANYIVIYVILRTVSPARCSTKSNGMGRSAKLPLRPPLRP